MGLAKARFESQLWLITQVSLRRTICCQHAYQIIQKPKWAKFRKTHSNVSARSLTGAEAAEMVADRAEKSSKAPRQAGS
jgi:hypothetical protein